MHSYTCPLRWSDLDAQGHVNNALLLVYLQEARVDFLTQDGAGSLLSTGVVVTSHQVEYRKAISYDDAGVRIELAVGKVGASRFQVVYDVFQAATQVAHARTELCRFDFDTNQPVRLSADTRDFLRADQVDLSPLRELSAPALHGRGHAVEIPVRWTDLDRYAHVNNAVVYDYVQQARITSTTVWDPAMARAGSPDSRSLWLVARQDVDYLEQISPGTVSVRTAPASVGESSLVLTAEIDQNGRVCARARTVLVCAGLDGRPQRIADTTRELLTQQIV